MTFMTFMILNSRYRERERVFSLLYNELKGGALGSKSVIEGVTLLTFLEVTARRRWLPGELQPTQRA